MDVQGHIFRKPNKNINTFTNERWNEVHRKGEREEEDLENGETNSSNYLIACSCIYCNLPKTRS